MSNMEDIDIICKQTGKSEDIVKEIYKKNNGNIIDTICEIENIKTVIKSDTKKLSKIQEKIKELREIADRKDLILDSLTNKG